MLFFKEMKFTAKNLFTVKNEKEVELIDYSQARCRVAGQVNVKTK